MHDQLKPNLYLVGFMGVGKTTIGRKVAQRLGMGFIDSDLAIEEIESNTVAKIFHGRGEAYFRALERTFIDQGHPKTGTVIACGGGLIHGDGMLELLRSKGVIITLESSLENILNRCKSNDDRPLLNVADRKAEIRKLLAQREPLYRKAGPVVMNNSRLIEDVVSEAVQVYQDQSALLLNPENS